MMDKVQCGYYINSDVYFDLDKKTLFNISKSFPSHQRAPIVLRETMFRLFAYLLENADGTIIENNVILLDIWDKHGLSSSNQRLWQVMYSLKIKLTSLGVPDDFIMRVESKGYYVKENLISVLYREQKPVMVKSTNNGVHHF